MKITTLLRVSVLAAALSFGVEKSSAELVIENPEPSGYTEEKPAFLYFKKGVVTRMGKNSIEVDLTLYGKIPNNQDDKIYYYIGFDIDNDATTGDAGVVDKSFGKDIALWVLKPVGTSRFEGASGTLQMRGKTHDLNVSAVKVSGDQVSFRVRSELFGIYDVTKLFFSASIVRYEKGLEVSKTQVDTLPRSGHSVLK